jgi:hypothetical protein
MRFGRRARDPAVQGASAGASRRCRRRRSRTPFALRHSQSGARIEDGGIRGVGASGALVVHLIPEVRGAVGQMLWNRGRLQSIDWTTIVVPPRRGFRQDRFSPIHAAKKRARMDSPARVAFRLWGGNQARGNHIAIRPAGGATRRSTGGVEVARLAVISTALPSTSHAQQVGALWRRDAHPAGKVETRPRGRSLGRIHDRAAFQGDSPASSLTCVWRDPPPPAWGWKVTTSPAARSGLCTGASVRAGRGLPNDLDRELPGVASRWGVQVAGLQGGLRPPARAAPG